MKAFSSILKIGLITAFIFPQTFDPETGELIKDKKEVEQFDPVTGELISESKPYTNYHQIVNPEQQGYQDARNNYIGDGTWAVLGGGASLLSLPPLIIIGAVLGENLDISGIGVLGGATIGLYYVPKFLAGLNSNPSRFVVQHSKLEHMSNKDKQMYIRTYSKELETQRLDAIRKGQLSWAAAGVGTIMLMLIMFS
jgi:hypothetical protein